jgi:hypothetical protein
MEWYAQRTAARQAVETTGTMAEAVKFDEWVTETFQEAKAKNYMLPD